jgi:putative nucleotidyltransferase-like protein
MRVFFDKSSRTDEGLKVPLRLLGDPDPSRDGLLLSALAPAAVALAAWRRWEASRADPSGDPVAARWLPLIGWHLDRSEVSDRSRRWLDDARRGTWAANTRAWASTEPALDRLESEGIEYIVLKGAALAWTVYDAMALRPIGDVDVLVRPEVAARASVLLEADHWRSFHRSPSSDLGALHAINYTRAPYGALDVHRYALRECCWPEADAGFWQRSVRATIGGRSVRVLGPADQLLHVCVHGLRWNPVHSSHWVADAARIIAHAGATLAWPVLVAEARRRDLAFQVREALRLVRRVTDAPVPDAVLSALGSGRVSWASRIECRVKARPLHSVGGLLLMWCDWRRLPKGPSSIGFARYLAHSMRLASPWELFPRAWQIVRHVDPC